jgi:phage terminase large subunit-like protein
MANYSTPNTRSAEWGHNGITFTNRGEVIASVLFPCGAQGPIDGLIGSATRKRWEDVVIAWREYAMLPDGAYFPRGLTRCAYSQQFILEVR